MSDAIPRLDATRSSLASRGLALPGGASEDLLGAPTLPGLNNQKHGLILRDLVDLLAEP